jgi:hypothetical protein
MSRISRKKDDITVWIDVRKLLAANIFEEE